MCEEMVQFYLFAYGYSLLPASLVEKIILSLLNYVGTFVENQLTLNVRVYFCTLDSTVVISMSIIVLVVHCIIYYSLVASFETLVLRLCSSFSSLLDSRSRSLAIPHEF